MKPDTRTVRELFERDVRYVVPLYQRPYVWDEEHQWRPLWEDIELLLENRMGGGDETLSHFMGAIVLEQELHSPGSIPLYTVIDGQQRLTTLQVLLAAAAAVAADEGIDREAAILRRLTRNDELTAEGTDAFKVWPTNANQAAFQAVLQDGGPPPDREDDPSNRIDEAHAFFSREVRAWLNDSDQGSVREVRVNALRVTLSDLLKVVSITLEPGDNAQVIFETLNARGTPLLALDLVKNAVFHAAARQGLDIDTLYHEEWERELDRPYWRTERRQGRLRRPRADLFLMHWLAMKLLEVVPAAELFQRFRQRILDAPEAPPADGVIRELRRDAGIMRSFENQPSASYEAAFFERLELLDTTVVLPVVLFLFRDARVSQERRTRSLRILESWLVRRALMGLTTKNYNMQVPAMLSKLAETPELADEALLDHLREGVGDISRWPTDEELITHLTTRPLYNWVAGKRIVMVLAAVEQSLYTNKVDIPTVPKTLSLEHVLPQKWEANWPLPEGHDPIRVRQLREERIHRLGNLTITAAPLNSAMSNAAWAEKQKELNASSKLLLNARLVETYRDRFDEDAIDERGQELAERICSIWAGPEGWDTQGDARVATAGMAIAVEPVVIEDASERGQAAEGLVTDIRRWADLLKQAAPEGDVEVVHERGFGSRARLFLGDAETVKYAYLDTDLPDELPLRLYPADTLEQARRFYGDPPRCHRLLALRAAGWEIEPNFHFGYMTRGLSWTKSAVPTDDYVAYWIERIGDLRAFPREAWDAELGRLIRDGIFDPVDEPQFTLDFRGTVRESATPRPGVVALRRWPLTTLDDEEFPAILRDAIREALLALGEADYVLAERREREVGWYAFEEDSRTVATTRFDLAGRSFRTGARGTRLFRQFERMQLPDEELREIVAAAVAWTDHSPQWVLDEPTPAHLQTNERPIKVAHFLRAVGCSWDEAKSLADEYRKGEGDLPDVSPREPVWPG